MSKDIDALVDEATETGQLRRDLRTERDKTKRLAADVADLRRALDLADAVQGADPSPPKWLTKKGRKKHSATLCLFITDTHLDEVVSPDEVGGLNAFDREIAGQRLERAFTGAVKVARDYLSGIEIDSAVVLWGGDIVSGEIHGELTESNEATTVETLVHWLEPLAAGVDLLAREFGKVHNVGVPGNHGRRTKRQRYKHRAADNYDSFLYHLLPYAIRAWRRGAGRVGHRICHEPTVAAPASTDEAVRRSRSPAGPSRRRPLPLPLPGTRPHHRRDPEGHFIIGERGVLGNLPHLGGGSRGRGLVA